MKKIVMIIMVAALVLPTMAQDWQSTSSMTGSGSAYGAQVTAVGAVEVTDMATTTESYSPAKAPANGPRRVLPGNPGHEGGDNTPLGDAVLPLLLCAVVFCGVTYFRRKRKALNR